MCCSFQLLRFIRILSPVLIHANEYTLSHIQKWLIHLSLSWVNFPVLVISSISHLNSSLWVDTIGVFLMHNCPPYHHIPSHNLDIKSLVISPHSSNILVTSMVFRIIPPFESVKY